VAKGGVSQKRGPNWVAPGLVNDRQVIPRSIKHRPKTLLSKFISSRYNNKRCARITFIVDKSHQRAGKKTTSAPIGGNFDNCYNELLVSLFTPEILGNSGGGDIRDLEGGGTEGSPGPVVGKVALLHNQGWLGAICASLDNARIGILR